MSRFGTAGASAAITNLFSGSVWVALGTGMSNGALLGEATGGNYSRAALGSVTGTGNQRSNAGIVTFPVGNATLGTFTHVALFDAASGGGCLGVQPLAATVNWTSGGPAVSFPIGALTFTMRLAAP